jgi:hypothetical protein
MYGVYLPTKLGDFVRVNVGKYSSTMEHMGYCMLLSESFRTSKLLVGIPIFLPLLLALSTPIPGSPLGHLWIC